MMNAMNFWIFEFRVRLDPKAVHYRFLPYTVKYHEFDTLQLCPLLIYVCTMSILGLHN